MLSLYEELFLLALDEEKGNFLAFTKKTITYGLSGAILAELTLRGKLSTNEKQRLELIDATPTGDGILDEAIQEIGSSEKLRKPSYWISQLSLHPKKQRARVGECLAAKNLIVQDENHFLWPQTSQQDAESALPSKFELKKPLREIIFTNSEPEPRDLALLNVANGCSLLSLIFTEDELPIAKRLLHEKVMHAALENPTLQIIDEIEYSILVSIEDESD